VCRRPNYERTLIHLNYLSHQETLGHFLCLVHFIFEMAPLVPQSTAEDLNFENLKPWICQQIHATFPCNYLGLPLSIKKPSRTELQPLLIKIANKATWMEKKFSNIPREGTSCQNSLTSNANSLLICFQATSMGHHQYKQIASSGAEKSLIRW
jgi:hypothetical protein